jgi:hypothetical protein
MIKKYNKIDGLNRELYALYFRKYTLDKACSRQSQSVVNLVKLKRCGITAEQLFGEQSLQRYEI